MLSGDNGLLKRAGDARDDTVVGQEKEQVELAYISAAVKKLGDNVYKDDLQDELDLSVGENKTTVTGSGTLKVKFEDTKNEYTVSQNGTVAKYEEVKTTDIYATVCANGTLIFSNNESDINTYLTNNSTSVADGYTIENIKDDDYKDPAWIWNDTITKVIFLNTIVPKNTAKWFFGLQNLTDIENMRNLNTSNVTYMNNMFSSCSSLTSLDLSSFDTSNVTDMSGMFSDCNNISSLNLSSFDTSNVNNMQLMFIRCEKLTNLNVSSFDTSNVTNMNSMFETCPLLATLDVRNFDTSKVTNMTNMFLDCSSLTSLDVRNFDTSKVTKMVGMFYKCNGLTSLDVSSFNTSNVDNAASMFADNTNLTTIIVSNKFVTTSMGRNGGYNMFKDCTSLVGGNGTVFNSSKIDKNMAQIDTASTPGYFTLKTN